ncbi:MAG: bifunctional metallophosphatase/5'-nucleotidase [Myxococcales bacterium]|nr:MAG: bifunctional metallophosphatase/5'-nucleotidase [Myxococcales bacterium]
MRAKLGWGCSVLSLACSASAPAAAPPPAELTLLHTSDVHSRLWSFRDRVSSLDAEMGLGSEGELAEVGGAARLATLLAAERRRGAAVWVDSGDLLEGAPVFGAHGGAVEVGLWGALGVAAMALGNHELSLGAAELDRLFGPARFPVLAANLVPSATTGAWLAPSATVMAGHTRLRVIGVGHDGSPPSITASSNPWGLSVMGAAASVQAAMDAAAGGAALVVVLSHLGLEGDRDLLRGTTGVDVVLGGHQHVSTLEPEWQEDCATRELQQRRGCSPRRVPIVHSGAYGRYLSKVALRLRPDPQEPGALEVQAVALTHLPVTSQVPEDPATAAHLEPYRPAPRPPVGYLPAPLTRSSALGGDSPLGNVVADAVRAQTGADVVVLNSSGLRDDLEAGPLLPIDLELAFPFEEPWRLASLAGRELRVGLDRAARKSASRGCESALQVSGLWLRVHCGACREELTTCWRAGRGESELRDDERLLVALPRYLTLPGADFEAVGPLGSELSLSLSQALRRQFGTVPLVRDPGDCARDWQQAPASRCAEAFGLWCPLDGARAWSVCAALPQVEGGRDGRIEMLP